MCISSFLQKKEEISSSFHHLLICHDEQICNNDILCAPPPPIFGVGWPYGPWKLFSHPSRMLPLRLFFFLSFHLPCQLPNISQLHPRKARGYLLVHMISGTLSQRSEPVPAHHVAVVEPGYAAMKVTLC
jgi:hypothetical protein